MDRRLMNVALTLFLVGVLQSCVSIKKYSMDVLVPAMVSLPPDIKSVIVIDNSKLPADSIEIIVSDQKGQFVKPNTDTIPHIALKQLFETLKQRAFFDTVYMQPVSRPLDRNSEVGLLNLKSILFEAQANNQVDAAIVLEDVKLFPALDYSPINAEVGVYRIDQSFVAHFIWVVLDLKRDSVLDVFNQIDSLTWSSYANELVYPVVGLPSINESVRSVADYFGYYYADRICPNWVREKRNYFTSSGFEWDLANASLLKNDWETAAKVWFGMYSSSKGVLKARMAHNIALSYEVLGNFEEAVKWSTISKQLYNQVSDWYIVEKEIIDDYYSIIFKRALYAKKLAEQMGM